MMNSSIDGHVKRPAKDCRICNKRRIKCDRSLPDCKKCEKRGYTCPGYGDRLKWGQGVASRGHLKGLSLPFLGSDPISDSKQRPLPPVDHPKESSVVTATSEENQSRLSLNNVQTSDEAESHQIVETRSIEDTSEDDIESLITPVREDATTVTEIESQDLVPFSFNALPAPGLVHHSFERRLLHHYDEVVCPQLAWVDSLENPWRTMVLPLASNSSSLLCTILAMAAADLASRFDHAQDPINGTFLRTYRDRALSLLADNFKVDREVLDLNEGALLRQGSNESRVEAKAVLAAVLILFYLEIKCPGLNGWRIHLQAASTILRRWRDDTSRSISSSDEQETSLYLSPDSTGLFLIQEFFSVRSWARFSDFSSFEGTIEENDDLDWGTFPMDRRGIFSDFVHLIQTITESERQKRVGISTPNTLGSLPITAIRAKLDHAYERTLQLGQSLTFKSPRARDDLGHAAGIFYHGILIYSYHVLMPRSHHTGLLAGRQNPEDQAAGDSVNTDEPSVFTSRDHLFHHLRSLGDISNFAQDLFWPMFIAGTECSGLSEEQELLETKILEVVKYSGVLDRLTCLQFLKEFWSIHTGNDECVLQANGGYEWKPTWIELAIKWAAKGNGFFVL